MNNYIQNPAPYNPYPGGNPYNPLNLIRQNERKKLRKTSNGLGLYVLFYFLTMQISATIIVIAFRIGGIDVQNPTLEFTMDIFLSILSALIPGLIYLSASGYRVSDSFGKSHVKATLLIPLVLMGMGFSMLANNAAELFDQNISIFGLENSASLMNEQNLNAFQMFLYAFAVSVIPALAEEFGFRGIVMGRLRKYGDCFAIIASAVMFGSIHGNTTQMIFAFLLGLILGFVDCAADSIVPSVVIHFANNFYAVVMDILQKNTNIEQSTFMLISIGSTALFCLAGILSFIYLAITDKSIFKFSSIVKSEYECSDSLTYKEKFKTFFTSPVVIISLVLFLTSMVFYLIIE